VGIGGLPASSPERGVQQFLGSLTLEGLLRVNQEGRLEPWLAKGWKVSSDGLRFTIELRENAKFHDGSPVTASTVVEFLRVNLPQTVRTVFDDVEAISADNEREVTLKFRRPSSFVGDSLYDSPIQKGNAPAIGTGPFMLARADSSSQEPTSMAAFPAYYLGAPAIQRIDIATYPNTRAAWAELLRGRLDMLYEVGIDAIDLTKDSRVALYAFDRPYQYMVLLNTKSPKLKSAVVRRALNRAIDRNVIVQEGLVGHGTPSSGPVSSHHWAFGNSGSTFTFDPQGSEAVLNKTGGARLTLNCLTPAAAPYEHLAIIVKQQLQAVGVDVSIAEVAPESLSSAISKPDFEALLIDVYSGWSLFPPYRWWHSKGGSNATGFSSPVVDAALDGIRHAVTDDEYRSGVQAFQSAVSDDPPAIFLAWSDRSRALSRRFELQVDKGSDIIASLRLLRPTADKGSATHN
jgi:peptide/nickel transport system substrate-binding protein